MQRASKGEKKASNSDEECAKLDLTSNPLQFDLDHFADDMPPSILAVSDSACQFKDDINMLSKPVPPPPPPPPLPASPLVSHPTPPTKMPSSEIAKERKMKKKLLEERAAPSRPHMPNLEELQDALKKLKKTTPIKKPQVTKPAAGNTFVSGIN